MADICRRRPPLRPQVLDLTGSRDFLTKESAEDTLKSMLAPGSVISKVWGTRLGCLGEDWHSSRIFDLMIPTLQIRFSTKSFGRDAARVAASAITNCKGTLVDADISDVIAGRPVRDNSS